MWQSLGVLVHHCCSQGKTVRRLFKALCPLTGEPAGCLNAFKLALVLASRQVTEAADVDPVGLSDMPWMRAT